MNNDITTTTAIATSRVEETEHDRRLIELWLHGRPSTTQRGYRAEIERFIVHVRKSLRSVTLDDLQLYADALNATGLQPATRRRMLAAVKSLFAFGHELGFLPFDTARPLRLPALQDTLAERVIEEASLLRLIAVEPNPRNAAMLMLMYAAGLRVSEVVGLRWRNLVGRSNDSGQVTVFGKGAKTRTILLPASVFGRVVALRCDACDDDPVFRSRKRGTLHPSQVLRITKAAARRAGLTRNVRNHDLRHSHCTHAIERGAPLHLVQATCGHASISTTGRYLHAHPSDSSASFLPL